MAYFTQSGNFIEPIEEVFPDVSYMSQRASDTGIVRQVPVQDTFHRVPLRPLLTKILECPGVLQPALQWQQRDNTDVLQDFCDGEIWHKQALFF